MNGATWQDSLRKVFADYASVQAVDPVIFPELLRKQGIDVDQEILANFQGLEAKDKIRLVENMWLLGHPENATKEARLELYRTLSDRFEELFDAEDDDAPGWFISGPWPP